MRMVGATVLVGAMALAGCQGRGPAASAGDDGLYTRGQYHRQPPMDAARPREPAGTQMENVNRVHVGGSVSVDVGASR